MKRRDFLKGALTVAALAPVSKLAAAPAASKVTAPGKVDRNKYQKTDLR